VRSQLTQVKVQKFTSTTFPRRSSARRGSVLSHCCAVNSERSGADSAEAGPIVIIGPLRAAAITGWLTMSVPAEDERIGKPI
jgi:hypothetical protein